MSKEIDDVLSIIDKSNPYASFLNESAISNVDGWLDTGSMVLKWYCIRFIIWWYTKK